LKIVRQVEITRCVKYKEILTYLDIIDELDNNSKKTSLISKTSSEKLIIPEEEETKILRDTYDDIRYAVIDGDLISNNSHLLANNVYFETPTTETITSKAKPNTNGKSRKGKKRKSPVLEAKNLNNESKLEKNEDDSLLSNDTSVKIDSNKIVNKSKSNHIAKNRTCKQQRTSLTKDIDTKNYIEAFNKLSNESEEPAIDKTQFNNVQFIDQKSNNNLNYLIKPCSVRIQKLNDECIHNTIKKAIEHKTIKPKKVNGTKKKVQKLRQLSNSRKPSVITLSDNDAEEVIETIKQYETVFAKSDIMADDYFYPGIVQASFNSEYKVKFSADDPKTVSSSEI
jgi:hypothetical protein